MFNDDPGATATYRALARGMANGWMKAYRKSQGTHASAASDGSASQRPRRLETPMSTANVTIVRAANTESATVHGRRSWSGR